MPRHPYRTPKRPVHGFALYVPLKAQRAILHLPDLQRRLVAERRQMVVELLPHLVAAGISQRQFARALGVSASALSQWTAAYERGGFTALMPKPAQRRAKGCALMATLEIV